jgi:hypothetical protein
MKCLLGPLGLILVTPPPPHTHTTFKIYEFDGAWGWVGGTTARLIFTFNIYMLEDRY